MKKKLIKLIYLLRKKRLKLAIAESCTGGMLSSTITSVSGSSKIFTVGLVTYSNKSKISILKVPKKIIFGPIEKTHTGKTQKFLLRKKNWFTTITNNT